MGWTCFSHYHEGTYQCTFKCRKIWFLKLQRESHSYGNDIPFLFVAPCFQAELICGYSKSHCIFCIAIWCTMKKVVFFHSFFLLSACKSSFFLFFPQCNFFYYCCWHYECMYCKLVYFWGTYGLSDVNYELWVEKCCNGNTYRHM